MTSVLTLAFGTYYMKLPHWLARLNYGFEAPPSDKGELSRQIERFLGQMTWDLDPTPQSQKLQHGWIDAIRPLAIKYFVYSRTVTLLSTQSLT